MAAEEQSTEWTLEISPRNTRFSFDLKGLWERKYLLWLFVKRDLTVQYKQTVFGFAWYFFSPLITVATYVLVFGKIAGIPTDGIPQPLFYLSGVCLWEYFSMCLTKSSTTLQDNAKLFGKVYFPRLVSPVSIIFSKMFRFSLELLVFAVVYLLYVMQGYDLSPTSSLLLFPLLVLLLQAISLGLGLIISSLSTKYRDLSGFFPTFVSLWMYATPVVYPLSSVTHPMLRTLMELNPITPITEAFRYGALGAGQLSWSGIAYSALIALLLLLVGIPLFNRKQTTFIDTI